MKLIGVWCFNAKEKYLRPDICQLPPSYVSRSRITREEVRIKLVVRTP